MIKRSSRLVLPCILLAVAFAAAGCSPQHRIQVDSNTCWHGTVNGDQYISGCGPATYKVLGKLDCARVIKESAGTLRVRIDDNAWSDTEDQYGFVQACN